MLKKQGIDTILLLWTVMFLFIADNLFLSYTSAYSQTLQYTGSDSQSVAQTSAPASVGSQSVLETSYKRYSLCRYGVTYILCEPYTVQNGDWIYKIFRSKGEISKNDFGLFLKIFKEINPDIKDMNAIKQGQSITIPLKKSNKNDFKESKPGVVDLPIITLSQIRDKLSKSTKAKPKESGVVQVQSKISSSIATDMPKESSTVTASSTTSSEIPVRQLKQLAMLNNGQLMMRGKYYFPRDNEEDLVIDVAFNPLMNLKNGSRILFVPQKNAFDGFTDTIRTFWRDFRIMEFGEVAPSLNGPLLANPSLSDDPYSGAHSLHGTQPVSLQHLNLPETSAVEPLEELYVPISETVAIDHKAAVKQLLEITDYKYTPEKEISVSVGTLSVKTTPGLISRYGKPDILVVFGDIYGSALEALEKMKYGDVVTISPLLSSMDVARKLFSALGASTTKNPSFVNPDNGKTILIDGVHVKNGDKELFITEKLMLLKDAFKYLTEKKIAILRVDPPL